MSIVREHSKRAYKESDKERAKRTKGTINRAYTAGHPVNRVNCAYLIMCPDKSPPSIQQFLHYDLCLKATPALYVPG